MHKAESEKFIAIRPFFFGKDAFFTVPEHYKTVQIMERFFIYQAFSSDFDPYLSLKILFGSISCRNLMSTSG